VPASAESRASGIAIQGLEEDHTPYAGVFERINAYALMAWFAVLAATVIRCSLSDATRRSVRPTFRR
jgi:hypothetical protein